MKYLLFLLSFQLYGQVQLVATIKLSDGTFINNAPSGRDWFDYPVSREDVLRGFDVQVEQDTLLIDDSEQNKINYYGDWRISTHYVFGPALNTCNCSWSNSKNDSLVFKFTNTKRFEWYGERMSHHGIVDIYFNDKYQTTIDTYSQDNKSVTLNWFKDDLDTEKVYKFKLVATGEKNPLSTGTPIVIQYFMLIQNTEPPIGPPDIIYIHDTIFIKEYYLLQPKFEYDTLKL